MWQALLVFTSSAVGLAGMALNGTELVWMDIWSRCDFQLRDHHVLPLLRKTLCSAVETREHKKTHTTSAKTSVAGPTNTRSVPSLFCFHFLSVPTADALACLELKLISVGVVQLGGGWKTL